MSGAIDNASLTAGQTQSTSGTHAALWRRNPKTNWRSDPLGRLTRSVVALWNAPPTAPLTMRPG